MFMVLVTLSLLSGITFLFFVLWKLSHSCSADYQYSFHLGDKYPRSLTTLYKLSFVVVVCLFHLAAALRGYSWLRNRSSQALETMWDARDQIWVPNQVHAYFLQQPSYVLNWPSN